MLRYNCDRHWFLVGLLHRHYQTTITLLSTGKDKREVLVRDLVFYRAKVSKARSNFSDIKIASVVDRPVGYKDSPLSSIFLAISTKYIWFS